MTSETAIVAHANKIKCLQRRVQYYTKQFPIVDQIRRAADTLFQCSAERPLTDRFVFLLFAFFTAFGAIKLYALLTACRLPQHRVGCEYTSNGSRFGVQRNPATCNVGDHPQILFSANIHSHGLGDGQ